MNLEAWVCSWDEKGNERLARTLRAICGVPKVSTLCMKDHEGMVWNYALDMSTADFVLICDSDIEITCPDFVRVMYEYISQDEDVGLISCNREGEPRQRRGQVVEWWNDSPAPIFRNCGVRFDNDMIGTGWQDVEIGLEYQYQNYKVVRDHRVSIDHKFANWGEKSAFYGAYVAHNRILMDTKWYRCGRRNWESAELYNESVPKEIRIPTLFDLMSYGHSELEAFAASVETELPWFMTINPNETWTNPVMRNE